jgi:hypothetical protein
VIWPSSLNLDAVGTHYVKSLREGRIEPLFNGDIIEGQGEVVAKV